MATYAIGDLQGCYETFQALLRRIAFDPARDRLWLVGDLVNRGTRSAEVLRYVRGLDSSACVVLGNHDLHLIARTLGAASKKKRDTLEDVLSAPDGRELVEWLRQQPLVHREGELVLVHAGLLPSWTVDEAEALADQLAKVLRGDGAAALLRDARHAPAVPFPAAPADQRLAVALQAFARLRLCRADGAPCDFDGHPRDAPPGCVPWFDVPGRPSASSTIVFGHWSALGLYVTPNVIGLDTGCVWGRALTAMRLDDRAVFSEPTHPGDLRALELDGD